ncbi:hypothetical protein PBI_BUTTERS_30 [Mycobacterium phage Butters]|uniref:Uncharacterized protein n=2 Tax=Charlievirus butters TaxID=2169798 RepID=A0A2Z5HEW3_9CAUD|nr:hypothetical protein K768_gp30 [Mycobacterium phage Butters]AGI12977.1 hypothetical protein PBI_BUTTERS_30 [Mycobacterium phage Butters]AXC38493.1 hypothetical protein SEA_RUBEELU_30 [Mycobacterium phage Rubeelu]
MLWDRTSHVLSISYANLRTSTHPPLMTNYGFRLFQVGVYRNGRGDPCAVDAIGDDKQHFRDYLFDLANRKKDCVVHGSPPRSKEEGDSDESADVDDHESVDDDAEQQPTGAKRPRPVLVITDVSFRGDHVVIEYLYGRDLGYTHAGYSEQDTTAKAVRIANLKSVRPYRSVFMFPDVGNSGVVAVEDASRAHASKKLEQWLKAWAREEAHAVAEIKRKETGKKSIKPVWWSMRFTPLSDPERLAALMKNGTSSKIVLTKQGGSDARTPGRSPLKVEMGLDEPASIAKARRLITGWLPKFNRTPQAGDAQVAANRELAAVLADNYQGFDEEDYDDAWIEVKDAAGKAKKISPSRWADIFIYPVRNSTECPPPALFYRRVQESVRPLEKSLELSIDWAGWGGDSG